jgi:hypothetical protein
VLGELQGQHAEREAEEDIPRQPEKHTQRMPEMEGEPEMHEQHQEQQPQDRTPSPLLPTPQEPDQHQQGQPSRHLQAHAQQAQQEPEAGTARVLKAAVPQASRTWLNDPEELTFPGSLLAMKDVELQQQHVMLAFFKLSHLIYVSRECPTSLPASCMMAFLRRKLQPGSLSTPVSFSDQVVCSRGQCWAVLPAGRIDCGLWDRFAKSFRAMPEDQMHWYSTLCLIYANREWDEISHMIRRIVS